MSPSTSSDSDLDERIAAVLAEASTAPDLDDLLERARRLDERLSRIHAALATARSVQGYELAREIAAERDAICARIGLWVVRSGRTVDEPSDDSATRDAGDRSSSNAAAPEVAPATEAAAEPQAASAEEVSSFVARVSKNGFGTGAALAVPPPTWPALLDRLLARMGAPPLDETEVAVQDEVELVAGATTGDAIEGWTHLPSDLQREFVSMLVARVSRLRDSLALRPSGRPSARGGDADPGTRANTAPATSTASRFVTGRSLRHGARMRLHYWDELQGRLDLPAHADPHHATQATTRRL